MLLSISNWGRKGREQSERRRVRGEERDYFVVMRRVFYE
jgi:hypothetical protein